MFKGAKGAKSSIEKVEKGKEVIIESRNEVGMVGKDVEEQGRDITPPLGSSPIESKPSSCPLHLGHH